MSLHWYALRVRSNFEETTGRFLTSAGYDVFVPTYRDRRRWADRTKEVNAPLFPGYLFCQMDVDRRQPVVRAPGFVSIVGFGNAFVPVPEEELAAVRAILNSPVFRTPWPYLAIGEKVVIDRGPLAGLEGILLEQKGERRLIVSVNLLQRSVAAEVSLDWVRPVRESFRIAFEAAANTSTGPVSSTSSNTLM